MTARINLNSSEMNEMHDKKLQQGTKFMKRICKIAEIAAEEGKVKVRRPWLCSW